MLPKEALDVDVLGLRDAPAAQGRPEVPRVLAAAGRDPLLARIPFLFVFGASRSACTL